MKNLQDLFDYYRQTNPSQGKLKSATAFLIHCCKALNLSNPEEITDEIYDEIPGAIDNLYKYSESQAIQDKSILAEMIGRYGPRQGWEKTLEILLNDPDENLCQFTLQSLEYYGCENPEHIYPYIERYINFSNPLMVHIASRIFVSMLCTAHSDFIQQKIKEIVEKGDLKIIDALKKNLQAAVQQRLHPDKNRLCKTYYGWLEDNTPQLD